MALSNQDRQTLIVATRTHRVRLGLDRETNKTTNSITRRSALAVIFTGITSRFGKRGQA